MTASNYMDLFFCAFILVIAVIGAVKGFIDELFGKGAPVIAIWMSIIFYKMLVTPINEAINIYWLSVGISFLSIFIVVFLLVKIVQKIVEAVFDHDIFNALDHFLGLVFGLAEGLAIVVLLLFALSAQPWIDVTDLLDGSYFFRFLKTFVASPADLINSPVTPVNS